MTGAVHRFQTEGDITHPPWVGTWHPYSSHSGRNAYRDLPSPGCQSRHVGNRTWFVRRAHRFPSDAGASHLWG